ncbi:hypothetical protein HC031_20745 [Planosporangium thailandense]|uniref:SseB protein N-terminal domain-containing protein n=1 Tax=Planosporangium thailandense TaxID=765197 RepID=A0ABX0Y3Z2_9ACTN|nr:SAV_915 family protein [Planosporangium thailandense]NJC72125.1 hypothetical protein [Planosporangium thailandense]
MDLPEVVYVPAYPDPEAGRTGVRFETRLLSTGEPVGVGFRSREGLVAALGPAQPWLAIRLDRLQDIFGAARIGRILIDPPVDEAAGRWTPVHLNALAGVLEGHRG